MLGCRLEGPAGLPGRLWYSTEETAGPWLTPLADPWMLSALFTAMRRGATLSVHGPVSRSLLSNLELFQKIWAGWFPGTYCTVDLEAEAGPDAGPGEGEAILAFSGGVDSCFSALRSVRGRGGRGRVTAGLTVHGFDVPIAERTQFPGVRAKASLLLGSLGLEALTLETNVRGAGPEYGTTSTGRRPQRRSTGSRGASLRESSRAPCRSPGSQPLSEAIS